MRTIVLDTDIGTDVDDILALGLALRSPEIDLAAVTVVYGDVELRARMVAKTLALAGRAGVPIGLGVRQPLLRRRPVYWAGHEGVGLLDGTEPAPPAVSAVQLITDTVRARPGAVTLVPIGPLTNIATALTVAPEIVPLVQEVVLMGGVAGRGESFDLPPVEHNIRCDPEAASLVFKAGWPITMVGLDVTTRVKLERRHLGRLAAVGTPLAVALADQAGRYMDHRKRDFTHLHDPLAMLTVIDGSLVRREALHVDVELQGEFTAGATVVRRPSAAEPANADVCLAVESERAVELFLSRLAS